MSDNSKTTQKFGPEWMRKMTDCPNTTTNTGGGPPVRSTSPPAFPVQYKRVDRRYGKEEMLDLYACSISSNELPEDLSEFSSILKEQPQEPLNYISITEEEQRLMSPSVNSNLALRLMGRPTAPPSRGRGAERGRGRGRGRGDSSYNRDDDNIPGFPRPRRGDWESEGERAESRNERPFPGRGYEETGTSPAAGGGGSGGGSSGSGSPSKSLYRSMSSEASDWRRKDDTNDNDDWRKGGRWNSSSRAWREPRESRSRNSEHDGYQRSRSRPEGRYDEEETPEWMNDDADGSDGQGTFDASGAFRSVKELNNVDKPKEENVESKNSSVDAQKKSTDNSNANTDDTKKLELQNNNGAQSSSPEVRPSQLPPVTTVHTAHRTVDNVNQSAKAPLVEHSEIQPAVETAQVKTEDILEDHARAAENLIASLNVDEKEEVDVDADKWFYRDPQGKIQGPFNDNEMWEWYLAGYFTMDLQLRKGRLGAFRTLGQVMKAMNTYVPFGPQDTARPPPTPDQMGSYPTEQYKLYLLHQQQIHQKAQICQVMFNLAQQENYKSMSAVDLQHVAAQTVQKQQQLAAQQQISTVSDPSIIHASGPIPSTMRSWTADGPMRQPGIWEPEMETRDPIQALFQKEYQRQRMEQEVERKRQEATIREIREAEEMMKQQKDVLMEHYRREEEEMRKRKEASRLLEDLRREEGERRRIEKLREEQDLKQRMIETEELRRRQQLEEQKRQREIELEIQRNEEIRKRQERQQAEARRRHHLPANATWGVTQPTTSNGPMPLSQIQQLEAQQMEAQQIAENYRQLEASANQSAKTWSAPSNAQPQKFLQIQQEQENELASKTLPSQVPPVSVPQNAVWGTSTQWARTGAWAKAPNTPVFEPMQQMSRMDKMANIDRIFEPVMKENVDFNGWCEQALTSIDSSVDTRTFISLLKELQTLEDVREICTSHFGPTDAVERFCREYVARRSSAGLGDSYHTSAASQLNVSQQSSDEASKKVIANSGKWTVLLRPAESTSKLQRGLNNNIRQRRYSEILRQVHIDCYVTPCKTDVQATVEHLHRKNVIIFKTKSRRTDRIALDWMEKRRKIISRLEKNDKISHLLEKPKDKANRTLSVRNVKDVKVVERTIEAKINRTVKLSSFRPNIVMNGNLSDCKQTRNRICNSSSAIEKTPLKMSYLARWTKSFFTWIRSLFPSYYKNERTTRESYDIGRIEETLLNVISKLNASNRLKGQNFDQKNLSSIIKSIDSEWRLLQLADKKRFKPIKLLINSLKSKMIKMDTKEKRDKIGSYLKPILLFPLNSNDSLATSHSIDSNYHHTITILWANKSITVVLVTPWGYLKEVYTSKFANRSGCRIIVTGNNTASEIRIFYGSSLNFNFGPNCSRETQNLRYLQRKCKKKIGNIIFYGKYRLSIGGGGGFVASLFVLFKHNKIDIQRANLEFNSIPNIGDDPSLPTEIEIPKIVFSKRIGRSVNLRRHLLTGEWSYWLEWMSCNVKCGAGERKRYRKCSNRNSNRETNKIHCEGEESQTKLCVEPACYQNNIQTLISTRIGNNVTLSCKQIRKSDDRQLSWITPTRRLIKSTSYEYRNKYKLIGLNLTVFKVAKSDEGLYHCIIIRRNGIIDTADSSIQTVSINTRSTICHLAPNICRNEGVCVIENDKNVCKCTKYFKGTFCERGEEYCKYLRYYEQPNSQGNQFEYKDNELLKQVKQMPNNDQDGSFNNLPKPTHIWEYDNNRNNRFNKIKTGNTIQDFSPCPGQFKTIASSPELALKNYVNLATKQHEQSTFSKANRIPVYRHEPNNIGNQMIERQPKKFRRNFMLKGQNQFVSRRFSTSTAIGDMNPPFNSTLDYHNNHDRYDTELATMSFNSAKTDIDQDAVEMCQKLCDSLRGIKEESDLRSVARKAPTTKITLINSPHSFHQDKDTIQNDKKSSILDAVTSHLGSISENRSNFNPLKHLANTSLPKLNSDINRIDTLKENMNGKTATESSARDRWTKSNLSRDNQHNKINNMETQTKLRKKVICKKIIRENKT
ncbi:DgyrCDS4421 [Dimorphilus gyrociliatus]|uniref:DgyrCDS4421 n=1 Tax=Dimorphilus gyrociliatus TaxID=2664684 RepID=A0A7I8VJL4_9ANNE|nr:DgyrCDS4421 [Dimorphilus gyrociliatus]